MVGAVLCCNIFYEPHRHTIKNNHFPRGKFRQMTGLFLFVVHLLRGTGVIASSSIFCPHLGRVTRELFRQLHAVWHGMEALSSKGNCSLLVSGHNLQADCQWHTLVPLLNCGANAALASVQAMVALNSWR